MVIQTKRNVTPGHQHRGISQGFVHTFLPLLYGGKKTQSLMEYQTSVFFHYLVEG